MIKDPKLAAAVVVYNMSCADSPTCRCLEDLRKNEDVLVLIYDNSTSDFGNETICREKGWVYLGGQGNVGISKAYNACVEYLLQNKAADVLCLFDDDTELGADYFPLLRKAMQEGGKIFVPLIRAGGKLISPCKLHPGHRVEMFSSEQEALDYRGKELSAINSCMALDLDLFGDYRYDENVFLDGVDNYFLQQMKERGESIRVFPYRCDHGFSGVQKPPVKSAMTRFRIYAKDYKYILRDQPGAYLRLVGKRALRLCIQYRTLQFLRHL